jgi:endonuclease YncB( thermonuclease family)
MLRIALLLALLLPQTSLAQTLAGPLRVIDGDTISVAGRSVRLHGIDAPESDQMCGGEGAPMWPCGAWVTGETRARYDGRRARCTVLDHDRYGRAVARCMVDGEDMGRALVQGGLAFAFRRYSMDYDLDEKGAAIAERGLHATGVTSPAAFRAAARRGQAVQQLTQAPEGCVIKGNISADGKRIYHMPGQTWYDRTGIREDKGERWFCTEAEARSAGWRRARR